MQVWKYQGIYTFLFWKPGKHKLNGLYTEFHKVTDTYKYFSALEYY